MIRITAIIAAFICMGCTPNGSPPWIDSKPKPVVTPTVPQIVEIRVSGQGAVTVGGDATITTQPAKAAEADTDVCLCGCGKAGCACMTASRQSPNAKNASPLQFPAAPVLPIVYLYSLDHCSGCIEEERALAAITDKPFRVRVLKTPPPWVTGRYAVPILHWTDAAGKGRMVEWQDWQGAALFIETWRRSMR